MRPAILVLVSGLVGCGSPIAATRPPADQFYFPSGLVHDGATGRAGVLHVASSDLDKRFDFGSVVAVDLDEIGLAVPAYLGGSDAEAPARAIPDLKISDDQRVLTAPYLGQMSGWRGADGVLRLFTPSRSEGDQLFVVDARGVALQCFGDTADDDCTNSAPSLTQPAIDAGDRGRDGFVAGKPRAPEPFGVAVRQDSGHVIVTHLERADSPPETGRNQQTFVLMTSAEDPVATADRFRSIGTTPSAGVVIGRRYAFVTGRSFETANVQGGLRLLDLTHTSRGVLIVGIESAFRFFDVRDAALSDDERRLFLAVRSPDALLIVDIADPLADFPRLTISGNVPLPQGPNQIRVIPRPAGLGTLLAITCTTANALVLYDDTISSTVNVLSGIGIQPFGLAVHRPEGAPGARIFVGHFGDGQVSAIDIPDVTNPADARSVAVLGKHHVCLDDQRAHPSCGGSP